jgi:hypothetical protein
VDGAATPEEAARGDIPERYARALVTEVSPDGRWAVVLLGTNEEPALYPYVETCSAEGGRWFERSGSSFGGSGWSSLDPDASNGLYYLCGEAPTGAVEAVVSYRDEERRVPVVSGYFIFVAWDIPEEFPEEPPSVRFVGAEG